MGVEVLGVDNVEVGKVVHVSEEDVDLDGLVETGTSSLQDVLNVLDTLLSFGTDGSFNWLTLWGVWDLTRDIDEVCYRCMLVLYVIFRVNLEHILLALIAWE